MRIGAQLDTLAFKIRNAKTLTDARKIATDLYTDAYREGFADGWGDGNSQGYEDCKKEEEEEL